MFLDAILSGYHIYSLYDPFLLFCSIFSQIDIYSVKHIQIKEAICMKKSVNIITICIVGLLITVSATAMTIKGPDERNNRFLPELDVNVMKVAGTPVSETLDVTGMKECKPNIKIRSTDIQVTDSEEDEYTPAIAVAGGGDLFLSYTSKESILSSSITWTFSTDDGETWDPGVYYDIDGTESHPAIDYLGSENKFAGTLLGPPGESDGALQYLFRCDDITDAETYELFFWDWTSYPYRDRRIPDIGGYQLDEVAWFYGIMGCAGTRGEVVDMPIFNYMNYETEDSGWSSYFSEYQGCENVAIEVDQTNGYFYAIFDYLNETKGDWDLLVLRGDCHNDGEGHPIWFDSLIIGGEENTKYPSVGVQGDQVIIIAQSDAGGTQDIVCYYSSDAGENWDMSIVANDAGNDEVYPAVISNGLLATCTFVMNGDIYVSSTEDGGATWAEAARINDESGTVVEEYHTASLCLGFGTWSDERNGNADIFFDTVGAFPMISIESISGGIGVSVDIKNSGTVAASNVQWSIDLEGGLVIIGGHVDGTISTLAPGASQTVKIGFVLGLGGVTITAAADGATKSATGTVLLFLVTGL